MRKGDESKKRIIEAAGRLFDRQGYANTSVQDILSVLNMSKGGFYHYFDTKMDLLTEVCRRRAESRYEQGAEYVRGMEGTQTERLDAALKLINFLDGRVSPIFGLMTEVSAVGEDSAVRGELRKTTVAALTPLIEEILYVGSKTGEFIVKRPTETAKILILLTLDVNEEAMGELSRDYRSPECTVNVLELLTAYRDSVETLINAPYGSVRLFELGDMAAAIARIISAREQNIHA